jgi:hypothetical protein
MVAGLEDQDAVTTSVLATVCTPAAEAGYILLLGLDKITGCLPAEGWNVLG